MNYIAKCNWCDEEIELTGREIELPCCRAHIDDCTEIEEDNYNDVKGELEYEQREDK